jgi:hypothetical protein
MRRRMKRGVRMMRLHNVLLAAVVKGVGSVQNSPMGSSGAREGETSK